MKQTSNLDCNYNRTEINEIKFFYIHNLHYYIMVSRSRRPRGLRRGSAAARLLRLWVRISPGTWTFVFCECYQVEVSATSWSLVQRSPTDCCASLCVI